MSQQSKIDNLITKFANALEKKAEVNLLEIVKNLPPELVGTLLGGAVGGGLGLLRPKSTRRLLADAATGAAAGGFGGLAVRGAGGLLSNQRFLDELGKFYSTNEDKIRGTLPAVVTPDAFKAIGEEGKAPIKNFIERVPGDALKAITNALPWIGGTISGAGPIYKKIVSKPNNNLGFGGQVVEPGNFHEHLRVLENLIPKSVLEKIAPSAPTTSPNTADILTGIDQWAAATPDQLGHSVSNIPGSEKVVSYSSDPNRTQTLLDTIQSGFKNYIKSVKNTSKDLDLNLNLDRTNNIADISREFASNFRLNGELPSNYHNAVSEAVQTSLLNPKSITPEVLAGILQKHNVNFTPGSEQALADAIAKGTEHLNAATLKSIIPGIQSKAVAPTGWLKTLGSAGLRGGLGAGAGYGAGTFLNWLSGSPLDNKTDMDQAAINALNKSYENLNRLGGSQ